MKKILYILIPVVLSMSVLTGCMGLITAVTQVTQEIMDDQDFFEEEERESSESYSEQEEDIPESIIEYTVVDEGRFEFSVPSDYEPMESGLSFWSPDNDFAIGINGVSQMGSEEPEVLFEQLVEFYREESQEVLEYSDGLSEFTSLDGSECFVGDITVEMSGPTFNYTRVVMIPNKNLMITVTHQAIEKEDLDPEILENLVMSLNFTLFEEDEISEYTFVGQDNGSEFVFNNDGSVQYYKSENIHDDNYFEGSYEVLRGEDAINELIAMTEYGYTQEELEMVMKQSMDSYSLMADRDSMTYSEDENGDLVAETTGSYFVCEDSFYLVKITWNYSKIDGVEEQMEEVLVPFLGHYIEELDSFDCLNLNTVSTQLWERK